MVHAPRGVPAGPVRAHLKRLHRRGATTGWLAQQSGVSEKTIRSVLHGERPTLYRGTADALLAVHASPSPSRRRVDPGPTIEHVQDLVARHWPLHVIARAAGLSARSLAPSNLSTGVSERTQAAIEAVWRASGGDCGPGARPYPWLAEQVAAHPPASVARGAGVSTATVQRLVDGHAVRRDTAARVAAWLTRERLAARPVPHIYTP